MEWSPLFTIISLLSVVSSVGWRKRSVISTVKWALEQKCTVCWLSVIGGGPNRQINPASEQKRIHTYTH
ncbi:hypothetical protein ILYODFUR_007802 [Ilyodon furcidens]|uniref:Secreted protein n=1 Tax=Ilyodon furcidens TaxID=33524 RepID=A0ABV0SWT9_9TELE